MKLWMHDHPGLFILAFSAWFIIGCAHLIGATEFSKARKRSAFEAVVLAFAMLVIWPLFSFGMMCRGYDDFWEKTWGDSKEP